RPAEARRLAARPATRALQERGLISARHARALTDALLDLDEATAAQVENRVLGRAPEQSLANFRASLNRAVLALTPGKTVDEQHAEAMSERRVALTPVADGMSELFA